MCGRRSEGFCYLNNRKSIPFKNSFAQKLSLIQQSNLGWILNEDNYCRFWTLRGSSSVSDCKHWNIATGWKFTNFSVFWHCQSGKDQIVKLLANYKLYVHVKLITTSFLESSSHMQGLSVKNRQIISIEQVGIQNTRSVSHIRLDTRKWSEGILSVCLYSEDCNEGPSRIQRLKRLTRTFWK